MYKYVLKRLLMLIPVIIGVLFFSTVLPYQACSPSGVTT